MRSATMTSLATILLGLWLGLAILEFRESHFDKQCGTEHYGIVVVGPNARHCQDSVTGDTIETL